MMKMLSPRETFDRQLNELKDQLLVLGSMVEQITLDAVDALKRRDVEAARSAYQYDQQINDKRFEIESACITIIATQQPIAGDLRFLASALEVATELERMGDYAKGIARICLLLKNQPPVKPITDLPRMAELATDMLHRALGAFVAADAVQSAIIPQDDDAVDDLYNQINRAL
ncbi:MAG: phosphate signaling complex protein PhoU, partial [Anaerolineae bacterium]